MNPQMQGGYRPHYPQAQGRSPAARRPGQMPPGPHQQQHPNLANAQHIQQQREIQHQHQMAQRRSKKPSDRNLPEGIDDFIIGGGVQQYKDLRQVEKKLDYAMVRKRLDMQDTFSRNVKRHQTMRIWISNNVDNQPWQAKGMDENAFDFNSGEDATYRVKIEGRLLDEPDEPEDEEMDGLEKMKSPRKRLSHFFRAINIEVDRGFGESTTLIDWKKQDNADFDCVDFERKGDENLNVTISLVREEQPERFRLSQALSQTLDLEEADRAEVLMGIWEYVKAMGLQEDEEKRRVRCDDRLKQIFGVDVVQFPQIPERIIPHLHPLPPVKLQYTIRVDPEFDGTPTIYDIRVATDDPLRAKLVAMTHNPEYGNTLRQIAQLDDSLAVLVQAVQHSKAKHTFYNSMAKDPANFVNRWMSSQQRDLEVILGERGTGDLSLEAGGPDGVWGTEVVSEAVRYRLAKEALPPK